MRQRKFNFLLVAMLVGSGLLFASGDARASGSHTVFSYNITLDGAPTAVNDNGATYKYSVVGTNSGCTSINTVEFELPMSMPGIPGIFLGPEPVPVTGTTTGSGFVSVSLFAADGITPITGFTTQVFATAAGDPVTKLGTEDPRYRVMKIKANSSFPTSFKISLTIQNQAKLPYDKKWGAGPQVVLIAAGTSGTDWGVVQTPAVVDKTLGAHGITANPNPVGLGGCTTLTWTTENASFAFISNTDLGSVTPTGGSEIVCPIQDTNYVLTAIEASGATTTDNVLVTLTADPTVPAPQTFQTVRIGDVQQGDGSDIVFKIARHPVYGNILKSYVCGDPNFTPDPGKSCGLSIDGRTDCCELGPPPSGREVVVGCTGLSGAGLAECIIAGAGSPHTKQIVSGTITTIYAYCSAKEIQVGPKALPTPSADNAAYAASILVKPNPFGFDCANKLTGQIHTDY